MIPIETTPGETTSVDTIPGKSTFSVPMCFPYGASGIYGDISAAVAVLVITTGIGVFIVAASLSTIISSVTAAKVCSELSKHPFWFGGGFILVGIYQD